MTRRAVRRGSYLIFFGIFLLVLLVTHLWALPLPYFWDEAGQYVPAALDLMHGAWISHSAPPTIHPPGVLAYLALAWAAAGFHPWVTRVAMLLVAAGALMAAFLLAIELSREVRGVPAFLVAALVFLCPVFFAQSVLAQLDLPAMLFTTLALLWFVQNRLLAAAAACAALVMVKETGAVVPLVFAVWLLHEKRMRESLWFFASLAPLAAWAVAVRSATGSWIGSNAFLQYNVLDPLQPTRILAALGRRLYYLFFANFHWMGTQAILLAWRTSRIFRSRAWRISIWLAAAHIAIVTLLGGAVLERYLLPILPILYTAMVAGLALLRSKPRLVCSAILLAGVAAGNLINPFYPFPYENNLAFSDYVKLHSQAAEFLARRYPEARIASVWPMTAEVHRPELGYVNRALRIERLPDLSAGTLQRLDWHRVDVLVVYSRHWDPSLNLLRWGPIGWLANHFTRSAEDVSATEAFSMVPLPNQAHFERRGQWVDVYANPEAGKGAVVLVQGNR